MSNLGSEEETAPYAPPQNVLDVLQHVRKRSLPDMLTSKVLTSIGIPQGNTSRVLAAFRFLHLIEDDGERQDTFKRLARATDEEYPEQLAQIIREAYKTVFTYVDPAEDDVIRLNNVFRQHYSPQAQRSRMVTLFLALCREAGIVTGTNVDSRPRVRRTQSTSREASQRQSRGTRSAQPNDAQPVPPSSTVQFSMGPSASDGHGADDYYALCLETLRRLPSEHRWTKKQRIRWLQAIAANVDLLVEVSDEHESPTQEVTVVDADNFPF